MGAQMEMEVEMGIGMEMEMEMEMEMGMEMECLTQTLKHRGGRTNFAMLFHRKLWT